MKERANKGTSNNSGQRSQYTQYRTETELRVRKLIDEGRTSEAEVLLQRVPESDRGAEWHFLKGAVCIRKGWLMEARNHAEIAVRMNPNNPEYTSLLNTIMANSRGSDTTNCSICDICTALMCLDCMCGGCR
jgi:Flp pilus assembly protein TadD